MLVESIVIVSVEAVSYIGKMENVTESQPTSCTHHWRL